MQAATSRYLAHRLGVFYHFSLATYIGIEWNPPQSPPERFAPAPWNVAY